MLILRGRIWRRGRGWRCRLRRRRGSLEIVNLMYLNMGNKEGGGIPPSIHSSSQKYLRLCLSIISPTKAPHIRHI